MTTVLDHLTALVRIPSVSHLSNRPVIEYAKSILSSSGWHHQEFVYVDAHGTEKVNLVAAPVSQNLEEREVELALVCHTDTVPFAATWRDALEPILADGLLYGCGACDVKGFLACLLTAASEIDAGVRKDQTRILLTADEEVGCLGAKHLITLNAVRARRMIIGEPTSLRPARAGKGYALAEMVVHGREAHSALPDQGVSAIYGAARWITAIEKLADELETRQNQIFHPPCTTINIGTIHGGTAKNVISGSCRFLIEWRPIPDQDPAFVYKEVLRLADALACDDRSLRYSAALLRQQAGFETESTSQLVRDIEGFFVTSATSIAFGSEASLFASAADEIVVFGPGDMRTAHSERECVPVHELDAAVKYLKQLLTTANPSGV